MSTSTSDTVSPVKAGVNGTGEKALRGWDTCILVLSGSPVLLLDPQTSSRLPPDEVDEARLGRLSVSPAPLGAAPELRVRNSLLRRTFREPFLDFPRADDKRQDKILPHDLWRNGLK